jgi:hypothetical protein
MSGSKDFDQGEFNFDATEPEDGYRRWREELVAAQRAFEERWGVILGKRVSVSLRDHAKPLVGKLSIVRRKGVISNPPELELRGLHFYPSEIVAIHQVAGENPPD